MIDIDTMDYDERNKMLEEIESRYHAVEDQEGDLLFIKNAYKDIGFLIALVYELKGN